MSHYHSPRATPREYSPRGRPYGQVRRVDEYKKKLIYSRSRAQAQASRSLTLRDLYKMPGSRKYLQSGPCTVTSPSSKRLPEYPPPTSSLCSAVESEIYIIEESAEPFDLVDSDIPKKSSESSDIVGSDATDNEIDKQSAESCNSTSLKPLAESPCVAQTHQDSGSLSGNKCRMKRHYEVPGSLNGVEVSAFPDTGVEGNVISQRFARQHNLSIQHSPRHEFQLPSGKVSRSLGTVCLPWQFAGESNLTDLPFSVLPKCIHDVILGGQFLKFTKTLTTFTNRIKTELLPSPPRLGVTFMGSERSRVLGSLDGQLATAVPDTGSDVMMFSTAYALRRGFKILDQEDVRAELEFVDGSRAFTRGIVKDVGWSFGDSHTFHQRDFHVLDDLPVDIVLNNDLLFDVGAFSMYNSSFYDKDDISTDVYFELSLVRQVGWLSSRFQKIFRRKTPEALAAGSNQGQSAEERRELQFRDTIDEAIAAMPESSQSEVRDRVEARRVEMRRRETWRQNSIHSPAGHILTPSS